MQTIEANRLTTVHHNKTRIISEETREKHRQNALRYYSNPENRKKTSIATKKAMKTAKPSSGKWKKGHRTWNKGQNGVYSEETLKIMSEKQKGNKNALGAIRSEETKMKLSISRTGKGTGQSNAMASEENRQKVAQSKLGRKWYHNPQTKQAICVLPENKPEGFIEGKKIK